MFLILDWKLISLAAAGSGYDVASTWMTSSGWNDTVCDVTRVLTSDMTSPLGMKSSFVDRFWYRAAQVKTYCILLT